MKFCSGKTRQVNNLKVRCSKIYGKWQVVTQDGKVLEEFRQLKDAIKSAKETSIA